MDIHAKALSRMRRDYRVTANGIRTYATVQYVNGKIDLLTSRATERALDDFMDAITMHDIEELTVDGIEAICDRLISARIALGGQKMSRDAYEMTIRALRIMGERVISDAYAFRFA